ncbi:uncharacterized protein LOC111340994 [Stylophora pistillata]|uniref:uncharacterized protein LOC111340994 n=1 Tax=Stylophora pistillata TaxID=50429 RepID=UPI000C03D8B5|nr:uncharacterized protein LOC111340994 [Stylophora pistillata]
MATSSSVIILFFTMGILSCCTTQEILKIWRESSIQVGKDDITVPESQCVKAQQQCDRYNAKHLTQCLCSCDNIGGEVSAFWEPNSTCIPVSSLRQQSECQLLFTDEKADQRLKFFPYNKTSLEKDVAVPTNQSCTFYYGDKFFVQYLDCGGSWKPITSSNALSTIELTPGWSTTVLKMRIKGGSTVFAKLTAGHLVRVPIQCRRANSTADLSSSCIVFMSDGQVECPYPKQTVNATHTIHPATLPTPVTRWLNWTEANRELETSTQTEARPMTTDGRLLSRPVENSTGSSLSPATSSLVRESPSTQTTSATESSTSKVKRGAGTNNVVIGIAVGCAVVFVIFLCFLVLLCKRRKSKKSQQETKSADRNPVVEIQIGRLMEHFSTSGEQESQSTYQELISNSGQGGTGHNTADDNSGNYHLYQKLDKNAPVTAAQAYQNVCTPIEAPDYQNVQTRVAATDYQNIQTPVTAPDYQIVQTPVTAPDYQNVLILQGGLSYLSVDTLGGQTESPYEPLKGCVGQNVYESLTKEATELHGQHSYRS